jgi:plastocyanin
MNKNLLIGIGAVVIIVAVIFMFAGGKESEAPLVDSEENTQTETTTTNTPKPTTTTKPVVNSGGVVPETLPAATVRYTDDGFSNTTITISKGGKVRFVNDTTDLMWVASDPHPSHSALPSFDQKRGVGLGGQYDYTFTEIGTWYFHNHLSPGHKGRVIVKQI